VAKFAEPATPSAIAAAASWRAILRKEFLTREDLDAQLRL
jgi:hypothetical protein